MRLGISKGFILVSYRPRRSFNPSSKYGQTYEVFIGYDLKTKAKPAYIPGATTVA